MVKVTVRLCVVAGTNKGMANVPLLMFAMV